MKSNKRKNKGISLIVLVITIIIMIILAGTIILSLSGTGLITNSNKGAFQSDISTIQEELGMYVANKISETKGKYTQDTLFASKDILEENGTIVEGKNIQDVLTSLDKKYLDEVEIRNGKIVYVGENINKLKWVNEVVLGVRKELKESNSETGSVILEKSMNLNLIDCKIYGNSEIDETGKIQSVGDLKNPYIISKQGYLVWTTGRAATNTAYPAMRTYTFCVKPNTTYSFYSDLLNNTTYCLYDKDMNYLGIYGEKISEPQTITFTTTAETAYVRICTSTTIIEENRLELKEVGLEKNEYIVLVQLSGKNLIDVKGLDYDHTKTYGENGITQTRLESNNGGYRFNFPTIKANTPVHVSFDFIDASDGKSKCHARTYDTTSSYTRLSSTQISFVSGKVTYKWASDIGEIEFHTLFEDEVGTFYTIDNLMIRTEGDDVFEPYILPKVCAIYLDEPLRKKGNYVDYIDFRKQEVVRNVEEVDGELRGLETPKIEKISLPNMLLERRTNILKVNTSVLPSRIETLHYIK